MAEITQEAYQDLRDYVQENWRYIELGDENDAPILRLSTTDSRVQWAHEAGSGELQLQVTIKGTDGDIAFPTTFASSSIYNVEAGGKAFSKENFNSFTVETENDELTVVHSIQIPQML